MGSSVLSHARPVRLTQAALHSSETTVKFNVDALIDQPPWHPALPQCLIARADAILKKGAWVEHVSMKDHEHVYFPSV